MSTQTILTCTLLLGCASPPKDSGPGDTDGAPDSGDTADSGADTGIDTGSGTDTGDTDEAPPPPVELAPAAEIIVNDPDNYFPEGATVGEDISGTGVRIAVSNEYVMPLYDMPCTSFPCSIVAGIETPISGTVAIEDHLVLTSGATADGQHLYLLGSRFVPDMTADDVPDLLTRTDLVDPRGGHSSGAALYAGPLTPGEPADAGAPAARLGVDVADVVEVWEADLDGDGVAEAGVRTLAGTTSTSLWLYEAPLAGDVSVSDTHGKWSLPLQGPRTVFPADVTGDGYLDLVALAEPAFVVRASDLSVTVYEGPVVGDRTDPPPLATIRGHAFDSIAAPGDMDGDGAADLVLGDFLYEYPPAYDPGRKSYGSYVGAAYVLHGPPEGNIPSDSFDTIWRGVHACQSVGVSVVPAGDTDGDGRAEVWIGAMLDGAQCPDVEGWAYLADDPGPGEHSIETATARVPGFARGTPIAPVWDAGLGLTGHGSVDLVMGYSNGYVDRRGRVYAAP